MTQTALPNSAAEPKVKVKMGENNYGKADVRLFKVFSRSAPARNQGRLGAGRHDR